MTDLLMLCMALTALLMSRQDALPVVGMLAAWLMHSAVFGESPGSVYYLSAAAVDWLVIVFSGRIAPVPETVPIIHAISLTSIAINTTGWLFWLTFQPPTVYNAAYIALLAWGLILLVNVDGGCNAGGSANDRGLNGFSRNLFTRGQGRHFNSHEVGT